VNLYHFDSHFDLRDQEVPLAHSVKHPHDPRFIVRVSENDSFRHLEGCNGL
jgi:hypothetical protein